MSGVWEALDPDHFVGLRSEDCNVLEEDRLGEHAAVLGLPDDSSGRAHPGIHWTLFERFHAETRSDGHASRMPPLPYPRRMWAGGRLWWRRPLSLRTPIQRRSIVSAATPKRTRSGDALFVTLEHHISNERGALLLCEEQDLVFLGADARYSALTRNGHRIHYDEGYARAVEGYPGLVVHGPLLATLLMNAAVRWGGLPPSSFEFRARRPVRAGAALAFVGAVESGAMRLAVLDEAGRACIEAGERWDGRQGLDEGEE